PGLSCGPRWFAPFGTRRDPYDTAFQMQCYSGIAPVKEASGKSEWVHSRRSCPKFLRQTFHEFAFLSTRSSAWAKAYYDRQRQQERSHPAAVRALAYKWIRIIFRCWKRTSRSICNPYKNADPRWVPPSPLSGGSR